MVRSWVEALCPQFYHLSHSSIGFGRIAGRAHPEILGVQDETSKGVSFFWSVLNCKNLLLCLGLEIKDFDKKIIKDKLDKYTCPVFLAVKVLIKFI